MLLTFSGNDNGLGIACIIIGEVDMTMHASITHGGWCTVASPRDFTLVSILYVSE